MAEADKKLSEVIEAIEICRASDSCSCCPYAGTRKKPAGIGASCIEERIADALYYLKDYREMLRKNFARTSQELRNNAERTAKVVHQEKTHTYWLGSCSDCETRVDSYQNYCPICGARLDWSEDE